MPYVITEACIDVMDRKCVDQCPVDCIYAGERMLYINPDECIDCAACEPVCPEEAIFSSRDLPAALGRFRDVNAELFALPGAAARPASDGVRGADHPTVAAIPPRIRDV